MSDIKKLLESSKAAHRDGSLNLAARGYAAVLAAEPESCEAWHLAGMLAHQRGRSDEGKSFVMRAIEMEPSAARYADLAAIQTTVGDYEGAESSAATALSLDPQIPAGHHYRGVALARMYRIDQAIHHLEKSLNELYMPERTLLEAALAFRAAGMFRDSIRSLEVLLELNPQEAAGYFHLSEYVLSGDYAFSATMLEGLSGLLESSQSDLATANLHFAMARHLESEQNYGSAMDHYAHANQQYLDHLESTVDTTRFSGLSAVVDKMIRFFDAERPKASPASSDSRIPIFVLGLPRSGTTLVSHILSSHPQVENAGELTALSDALQPLRQFWDCESPSTGLPDKLLGEAADRYLKRVDGLNESTLHVVDKMPDNAAYVGFIHLLFPNAEIVYCRRDPRDIAISNFTTPFQQSRLRWETSSLERIAAVIGKRIELTRHWRQLLPDRMQEVFYESLVRHPESASRELLQAITLPWSQQCLQHNETFGVVTSASVVQVRRPIHATSIGRWKRFAPQMDALCDLLRTEIEEYEADQATHEASLSK